MCIRDRIHAGNLQEVQNAIFKSFYRGTAGDNSGTENENDGEETTEEGNRAAAVSYTHLETTGKAGAKEREIPQHFYAYEMLP